MSRRRLLLYVVAPAAVAIVAAALLLRSENSLVVYTSTDSVYSRPLADLFEVRTGVHVELVPDAESAKTTGLYQRLLAERSRPRADVFWNSEISRTLLLAKAGVLEAYRPKAAAELASEFRPKDALWHGMACRARVIIYNKNLVAEKDKPRSIFDLADSRWKGRVAVAYPLFGTTSTHCAALRVTLGAEKANEFFRRLVANQAQVVNGNGIVAEQVAAGKALVGLTDTDDVWGQIDGKKPVGLIFPDQGEGGLGALVIPNTVGLIKGAPHPEVARRFIDFLTSAEAEAILARPPARHIPTRPTQVQAAADSPALWEIRAMKVDWARVAEEVERQPADLEKIFPR